MTNNRIIISRIQNRRGLLENLPQPLLPGEIALTVDTGELWIGSDRNQPPHGVRTYSAGVGDISTAESIVDTQIAVAKFTGDLIVSEFEQLVDYLTDAPVPAVVLTEDDILWDNLATVFIAADISTDIANTINNVLDAVAASPVGVDFDSARSGALGALNDPFITSTAITLTFADTNPDTIIRGSGSFITDGFFDGQKIVVSGSVSNNGTYTIAPGGTSALTLTLEGTDELVAEGPVSATLQGRSDPALTDAFDAVDGDFQFGGLGILSNAPQGSNAAILINEINGSGIVTTFGNLQITTSGIGVGSPTFRDITVTDTDAGFSWSGVGTASADSTTDQLTFVSGTNINIDVDTTLDAIRITNTAEADPDKLITNFTQTPASGEQQSEFILANSTGSFTNVAGLAYDLDVESDIIFIEYSLNIDGATDTTSNYTAAGRMRVVANNNIAGGTATLVDDQTEVRDTDGGPLSGDIDFQAVYVAGSPNTVQIQYRNTFTTDATMRVAARRWMSF